MVEQLKRDGHPQVTAIVLNWENFELSQKCIESLLTINYPSLSIIVVDNGSTDSSGEEIAKEFDEVEMIFNDENLGFAGGMNCGITHKIANRSKYIWLVSNDIQVNNPHILLQLVERLEENHSIAMITPKVLDSEGEIWFEQGILDEKRGKPNHVQTEGQNQTYIQNDYIPFCSALIRADIFQEVGLLWEPFFLYYEDTDFCLRVKRNDYIIETATNLDIEHSISESTGGEKRSPLSGGIFGTIYSYYYTRNRLLFVRRHWNRINLWLFAYSYLVWVFKATIDRLLFLEVRSAISILRGFIDGLRDRSGRGPYP